MVMRATKKFVVVAYDISNTKRRNRVVKILRQYGVRVNLSVFECMLTESQFENLKTSVTETINISHDKIIYYSLCLDCYAKITYLPKKQADPISTTNVI